MRQVLRRYAFPYMIIAAVLAVALPFSSFAAELVDVSDQVNEIWNARNWNYFTYAQTGYQGNYSVAYQYNTSAVNQTYNGVKVVGRQLSTAFDAGSYVQVRFPVLLSDVESFSTDLYFGLYGVDNVDGDYYRYSSGCSLFRAIIYSTSSGSQQIPSETISTSAEYIFRPTETVGSGSNLSNQYFTLKKLNLSSVASGTQDIAFVWMSFEISIGGSWNPDISYYFYCGMASDLEIGTIDGGSAAIIDSLSGLQGSIDILVEDLKENDGKILDELGNVVYELESDAVTTAEAENMVTNSVTKGEQLEQLGDSLSNVPKPNVNNVTSVIKPSVTLTQSDPELVQSALSVIYSWDRLLAILAVVIALGTISYILFGKKS